MAMAGLSGWLYHVTEGGGGGGGGPVLLRRFVALSGRRIAMYAEDPTLKPLEKPVRRGVAGLHQRVEDLGRQTFEDGKVLHVLRLYNELDPTKEGKFGCSSAEAAQLWISAFRNAQEVTEKEMKTLGSDNNLPFHRRKSLDFSQTVERGVSDSVHIPDEADPFPGFHRLLTLEKSLEDPTNDAVMASASGDDAMETADWQIFKVADGLRFFEDINASKVDTSGVIVRAVGTVDASADAVFELLMNTDKHFRSLWDPLTTVTEIVEVIDGHNDILYSYIPSKYLKQWQRDRDVVYSRYWRRDQDGSYSIAQFATSHPNKPPVNGVVRIDSSPGAWEVVPLPPRPGGGARSLLRHTLELTAGGWAKWRPTYYADFEQTVPYVSLMRIAGMREFFNSRTAPWASVESGRVSVQPAPTSDLPRGTPESLDSDDMNEEFHDAIAVPYEDEEYAASKSDRAKSHWREVRWSVQVREQLKSLHKQHTAVAQGETCPRDLDSTTTAIAMDGLKMNGSLARWRSTNDTSCWSEPAANEFAVRGDSYLQDRVKVSGRPTLLKLVAVDWFKSPNRVDNVSVRPGSLAQSEAARSIPFLLVINLQVPGNTNYSMVFYFAADRPILKGSLLDKFVNGDSNFRNQRFKLIPRIVEGYWAVKRAVGTKACLLGKAITCRYLRQDNFLEIDCDIGASSVARGIMGVVVGYVTSLVVDLAVLIEAVTTEELPEYLLGAMRVHHLSLQDAVEPPPA